MKILRNKNTFLLLLVAAFISQQGCNKKEFLEKIPDSELLIPTTLEDCRRLLDNERVMSETPVLGELSADNFYLPVSFWQNLNTKERNGYTWSKDVYNGEGAIGDWDKPYQQVFYANVVREALLEFPEGDRNSEWHDLYGSALFIRAYAFYNLAQVFAPPFDPNISNDDNLRGIPLRTESDIANPVSRATVKATYEQILDDLDTAVKHLPPQLPSNFRNRPSRPAAYALLARVCLSKRSYDQALLYADSSLSLYNTLMSYSAPGASPFSKTNAEVLYQSRLLSTTSVLKSVVVSSCLVDTGLYRSYNTNDLRKTLYFSVNAMGAIPRISYTGSIFLFSGLATDEVYLIKAECLARSGRFNEGMEVLNTLLQKRWGNVPYVPLTADNKEDALNLILTERRKELVFRGLRWTDLRRFNKEGRIITLKRNLSGTIHELPPNHINYVLPIPDDAMAGTNMIQNPRK